MWDAFAQTQIDAPDVDAIQGVEIFFFGLPKIADECDGGIIHEYVDAAARENFSECGVNAARIGDVAAVGNNARTRAAGFTCCFLGSGLIKVQDRDASAAGRERAHNRAADSARTASDYGRLAI
jgi:hypothetical protein